MNADNAPPDYRTLNRDNAGGRTRSYSVADAPPDYIAIFADPQEELPPDAQPTQHRYSTSLNGLLSRSKKPWLTLDLVTRSTTIPQWLKTPRYFGGDSITGTVALNLETAQSIASIVIILKGRVITSFEDIGSYVFLQHTHTVWKKADGDPRISTTSTPTSFNGKFIGEYAFPFSFAFPTEIDFAQAPGYFKGTNPRRGSDSSILTHSIFSCPQSFLERNLPINIEYELCLQVSHGLLRFDTKIKTPVVFIPEITPEPCSLMRAEAYAQAALLPSPLSDPEGWHACMATFIVTNVQSGNYINLEYTLYLAKPLSYTRGTVIPCYLSIACEHPDILQELADTKMKHVRLMRRVRFFTVPLKEIERHLKGKETSFSEVVDEVDIAVWWQPLKDVAQELTCTILEGEIHLAKELVPTADFLPFSIMYSIEMLPPNTANVRYLESASNTDSSKVNGDAETLSPKQPTVLISQLVTIATFNATGPQPTPFTERRRNVALKRQRQPGRDSGKSLEGQYGLHP